MAELTTRAGDLLFMPRGLIHEVWTSDESSLHVTFGTLPTYAYELLRDVLPDGHCDPGLRLPLPWRDAPEVVWEEYIERVPETARGLGGLLDDVKRVELARTLVVEGLATLCRED